MTTAAKAPRIEAPSAESQLAGFIEKFDPDNQTLIVKIRKALQKRFPTANELVYDNYNFFVIGYSPTERPSDTIVSIAAASSVQRPPRRPCAWFICTVEHR